MGRSGYTDDYEYLALYRRAVENAMNGERGQRFLRDLIAALEAMPEKRLIAEELVAHNGVCALGCVAKHRGVDLSHVDPSEHEAIGYRLGIPRSLVAEVEYENDGDDFGFGGYETDEERWAGMLRWAKSKLKNGAPDAL